MLAGKKIPTPEHLYWAEVEGDIENVNGVLKITTIRVKYHLKVGEDKAPEEKGRLLLACGNHVGVGYSFPACRRLQYDCQPRGGLFCSL